MVKPALAEPFLARLERATTSAALDEAFPLDVLAATSEVEVFYAHYGV